MSMSHDPGQGAPQALVPMMSNQHAFFIVGSQTFFLVHMINTWMDCHRYQVVLRVTLPEASKREFLSDRRQHPHDWYVVGNLESDLIALPNVQRGACTSYQANIWRGWPTNQGSEHWPWANDKPVLAQPFKVNIDRVVYFRRLDFNADYPRTTSYVLFGEGDEAHINHCPVKQPDYDHVASLRSAPDWLPKPLLEAGVPVNFPQIPAVPGGDACREAMHESNPLSDGRGTVQYAGFGPKRPIHIERTVFFGTWPFNRTNQNEPWAPCGLEPGAPGHH